MPRLNAARTGLDQERVDDKVVVPVDQQNLGLGGREPALERLRAIGAAVPTADDHDPDFGHAASHCGA